MKLRSALLSFALCLLPVAAWAGHYGVAFPEGEAVAIDVAAAKVADHAGKPALFSGRITEVCQKEGCWLVIENNGQSARVMVEDHAFAVPKDAKGLATVYGVLSEKILDDKAAKHLAEDAGRSEPVARRELRIAATAVAIAD
jgi:hypothetical protein